MQNSKSVLIIKASRDLCSAEIDHIKSIAEMIGMRHEVFELSEPEKLAALLQGKGKYDYIYVAAHANASGFGDADGTTLMGWHVFGDALCRSGCLNEESILLLACCRGGLKNVALSLFGACLQIDYVCGPRWVVTGLDLTAGFHVFVYNMEIRHEQPSCAAERASRACFPIRFSDSMITFHLS